MERQNVPTPLIVLAALVITFLVVGPLLIIQIPSPDEMIGAIAVYALCLFTVYLILPE